MSRVSVENDNNAPDINTRIPLARNQVHAIFDELQMAIVAMENHAPTLREQEELIGEVDNWRSRAFNPEITILRQEMTVLTCLQKIHGHAHLRKAVSNIYLKYRGCDIGEIQNIMNKIQSEIDSERIQVPDFFTLLPKDIIVLIICSSPLIRIGDWRVLCFYFYSLCKQENALQNRFEQYLSAKTANDWLLTWRAQDAVKDYRFELLGTQLGRAVDFDYMLEVFTVEKLGRLALKNQNWTSALVRRLFDSLQGNPRITELNLVNSPIDYRNANEVVRFLSTAANLETLVMDLEDREQGRVDLSPNDFPSFIDQVLYILSKISRNLKYVELSSYSAPSPESASLIAAILRNNSQLNHFRIWCKGPNSNTSFKGNFDIQEAILQHPRLEFIRLPGFSNLMLGTDIADDEKWLQLRGVGKFKRLEYSQIVQYCENNSIPLCKAVPDEDLIVSQNLLMQRILLHFQNQNIIPSLPENGGLELPQKILENKTNFLKKSNEELHQQAVIKYITESVNYFYKKSENEDELLKKVGEFLEKYFKRLPVSMDLYLTIIDHLKKVFYAFLGYGKKDTITPWNCLVKQLKTKLLLDTLSFPERFKSIRCQDDQKIRKIFAEPTYIKPFFSSMPVLDENELHQYEKAIRDRKVYIHDSVQSLQCFNYGK